MSEILHPSALPSYFRAIISGTIMSVIVFLVRNFINYDTNMALIIIWIISILFSIVKWIKNRFISIELTDTEIIYKTGILNIKNIMVPFGQITNMTVNRSLFARIMGLGHLDIDTASHQADIDIYDLQYGKIELILQKTKGKLRDK